MMKRVFLSAWACAALLLSCAKETVPSVPPVKGVKTYTLTVEAGKGEGPDTKALSFNGNKLEASWTQGDTVTVMKGELRLGKLTAQGDGVNTTLSGTVTGELAENDEITLKYQSPNYASQDGTLAYIAAHCDYAVANVTVQSIAGTTVTTTSADFQNQQAIVKLILKQGGNDITADVTALTISSGTNSYAITRAAGPGPIYVAIKAVSDATIDFAATDGTNYYEKTVTGKSLANGSYYAITLGMSPGTSLISYVRRRWDESSKTVLSETVVEHASSLNTTREYDDAIAGTWYVTGNLDITSIFNHGLKVRTGGTLNLVLCDGADLKSDYLWLENTGTLRIFGQSAGTGKLTVDSSIKDAPAIGLKYENGNGGTLEIHGGVIHAEGAQDGPGIGARTYYLSRLAIFGGTVNATGGTSAAGIGRGFSTQHDGGVIDIYGGNITAQGGNGGLPLEEDTSLGACGIGDGDRAFVAAVNIYGGVVNATGGTMAEGICAFSSNDGSVNIYGGNVTATGGSYSSGIYGRIVNIYDGSVSGYSGTDAAAIGGGERGDGGEINIYGGTVRAYGGSSSNHGAGIGGGQNGTGGTIRINGGTVYAYAGMDAAAIGGGEGGDGGTIFITGGNVYAYGNALNNSYGAGIGGGQDGSGGSINISGGEVYAYGGVDAAGIGAGEETLTGSITSGNISITGGRVYAQGKGKGAGIGSGEDAKCTWVNIFSSSGTPLYVEAIGGEECGNEAGSIGSYKADDFGGLNIGPRVRIKTYNNTTVENLVTTDDRAYTVHHRRRAILFTCNHEGYTATNCPYCTH